MILLAPFFDGAFAYGVEKLPLSSQHYQVGDSDLRFNSEVGFSLTEKTYETDLKDFEIFNYQHLSSLFGFDYGLSDEHSFSSTLFFNHNGRLKKIYDDQSPLDNIHAVYSGIEKLEFSFKSRFSDFLSEGIDQSVVLKIQSGLKRAKDQNASIGQTDFFASYLFSFYISGRTELYGEIDIAYMGKKKKLRLDGETEISDTYAKTSLGLGLIKRLSPLFFFADASFGMTTNYNIKSKSYSITTDKGFYVRAQIGLGYEISRFLIEFSHLVRTDVYNQILPDGQTPDPSLHYEWEASYTSLKLSWTY